MTPERHHRLEPEEMAELLPAPGDPVLGPERHRVLRQHLMREIGRKKRKVKLRPFLGRRLAVWAAPLALAATVATGTVVVDGLRDGREAVQTPGRSVTSVGDPPAITMGEGQFLYKRRVMSRDYTPSDADAEIVQREDWHAVDGGRDGRALTGPEPADTDRLDPNAPTTERMAISGSMDYRELQELPADPQKLLKHAYRKTEGQGRSPEEAALGYISTLLEPAALVPGLSEALYRAARRIPGIVVEGEAQDRIGRTGTGLSLPHSSTYDRALVFDVSSFVFLGVEETTALLEIGVADRVGEPPVESWKLGSG